MRTFGMSKKAHCSSDAELDREEGRGREREIGGGKTKEWENSGKMIQFHNLSDCSLWLNGSPSNSLDEQNHSQTNLV